MINKPRGTEDILPADIRMWQMVESVIHSVCSNFGFNEIRTPVFEHTELFRRGVGDTSDVVQKEMYTFSDKGERSITLRPEGTASVVRSYLENSLYANPQPTKLYYLISCYRYEKPQAGRLREFHQFGVECFGASVPSADAEIISLAMTLLKTLKINSIALNINSIGCPGCRKEYNEKLKKYFMEYKDKLCGTCLDRLDKNPMRILDCKSDVCKSIAQNAPKMLDCLCDNCKDHFEQTKQYLDDLGIEYNIDTNIVRGLDYYTKTVFEITSDELGAQSTICGGGRYDGLVEELGGAPTPGIGFALGMERLIMLIKQQGSGAESKMCDILIATIGETAEREAQKIVYKLRNAGIFAEKDLCGRSLKAQMKYADKIGAYYSVVLGDDEIATRKANLKNMQTGEQTEVDIDKLEESL